MAVTNGWGKGAQNNTNGWGKSGTNNIGYGAIYESSAAGDTSIIGTSAAFLYSKSSYNQGEADPTPTITGTAGGSFNASANVVFVDTGTYNSSTGQIDLSATSIGSHIITYTVNGVQSGQTVGVTAAPYQNTSSFTFDGLDDYFETPPLTFLNGQTNASWSIWIKPTDSTYTDLKVIYHSQRTGATNTSSQFLLTLQKGVELQFSIYGTSFNIEAPDSFLTYGNWNHVLVTYDASGSAPYTGNMYINGVDRTSSTNLYFVLPEARTDVKFRIGKIQEAGGYPFYQPFLGNMDEFSIWNTTLSQSAVTEIYNSGAPNDLTTLTNASNTNLKAWYKF